MNCVRGENHIEVDKEELKEINWSLTWYNRYKNLSSTFASLY